MTNPTNNYSLPLLLAIFLSIVFVASALGVLVWALGWGVLLVLGAAFVVFIVVSVVRDALRDAHARK